MGMKLGIPVAGLCVISCLILWTLVKKCILPVIIHSTLGIASLMSPGGILTWSYSIWGVYNVTCCWSWQYLALKYQVQFEAIIYLICFNFQGERAGSLRMCHICCIGIHFECSKSGCKFLEQRGFNILWNLSACVPSFFFLQTFHCCILIFLLMGKVYLKHTWGCL